MKKNYWMAGALVCTLAATITGCNNEELDDTTPDGKEQRATITASIPQEGANTRVSYDETDQLMKLAWEANDAIGVWKADDTTIKGFTTANAGASTNFTATNVSFETDNQLYAIYPKPSAIAAGNVATLDLSAAQKGVLNKDCHYMYAFAKWQEENTANFSFMHAVSILKLTLDFSNMTTGVPTSLKSVTLSATGLHNKATLTMGTTPTISGTATGNITASGTFNVSNPIYLYVFPETLSDIKITATDGFSVYEGTLSEKTVEARKVYKATIKMTQSGPEYYYKDGTHSLDYKGTQDNPCIGIVIDVEKGLILSDRLSVGKISWATKAGEKVTTNTTNDDGRDDVALLKAISPDLSQYPVAKACDDYDVGGKGWYLPSKKEVEGLKGNSESATKWNTVLTTAGFTGNTGELFWTTTEDIDQISGAHYAFATAWTGNVFWYFKYETDTNWMGYVRCVKRVTL